MRTMPAAILGTILFFLTIASLRAGEPGLRCRWLSPDRRAPLDVVFMKNPLLVLLPGENLEVSVSSPSGAGHVTIMKDGKPYRQDNALNFTATQNAGSFYIPLAIEADGVRRSLEICVLVPHKASARKSETGLDVRADNQEIGHYRFPARSGNRKVRANPDSYQPPVWWMRLTDTNKAFEVWPGLTAGELVVPSEDTNLPHTDLVPVRYPMWQAIHALRTALDEKGIPGNALKIISVYRAPAYNRRIGSGAFGRHIYGDAFDFYIDLEGDGKASDLNRDGKRDRQDAYPVVAVIEDLMADGKIPLGGIGVYNTVAGDHIVTMHVDNRGHRATWGYYYPPSGKKSDFSWASKRFAEIDRADEDAAAERAAKEGKKYARPRRDPLP